MNPLPQVVVTGVGVVAPVGVGADSFWDSLVAGRSGVSLRAGFEDVQLPHRIAASVSGFVGKDYIKPRKSLKIMCGPIQYGCAAAAMAVDQANFAEGVLTQERVGTVFGTETFFADPGEVADVFQKCMVDSEYQHDRWGEFALREIQPLWMLKYLPNMAASHISIAMDARGPSNSICQGEASGLLSLVEAADLIQRGVADVVVAGGTGSQMALVSTLYRGVDSLATTSINPSRPRDLSTKTEMAWWLGKAQERSFWNQKSLPKNEARIFSPPSADGLAAITDWTRRLPSGSGVPLQQRNRSSPTKRRTD